MKVKHLMTPHPVCCGSQANLAEATELMWSKDCGALPVVDDGKLTGILTDRDISIALGTRNVPAAGIAAGEVATHEVKTCNPGDDVHEAMALMRRAKVHRLPVVNERGELVGMLALNDLILAAERKHGEIDYEEVMNTVKAISEHRGHGQARTETAKPEAATPEKITFPRIPVVVA